MSLRKMSSKTLLFSALLLIVAPPLPAVAQDVDVPGNLTMRNSTDPSVGNVLKEGVPFLHNFGTSDTFLGSFAGNFTMTGGANTASGFQALAGNTTGSVNTASGADALTANTTGIRNTADGAFALFFNTTGDFNTASGNTALANNTSGSGNTALGFAADVSAGDLTNATAIGYNAIVDVSNKVRVGNHDVTVIEGEVGFTCSSDRNKKEHLRPVEGEAVLTKIRGMSLTSWNFIGHDPKQFRHYGPMAQDFFAAFGHDGMGTIGTPTTITSTDMDGILMVAAQALEKRTVEQRKRIDVLTAENADLKARLEALERRVRAPAHADQ